MTKPPPGYRRPGPITRGLVNPMLVFAMRLGMSVWGSRILEVRGRKSGAAHRTPVNLLAYEGRRYLVSARGETQWVRNVRAADGRLILMLGRSREEYRAAELADSEKPPVLSAYLRRWRAEVGVFFDGVGPGEIAELVRIAPDHPVFVLDH